MIGKLIYDPDPHINAYESLSRTNLAFYLEQDQEHLDLIMISLPSRVSFYESPKWSQGRATEALYWCHENVGDYAITYGEMERHDVHGEPTIIRRKRSWNPEGTHLLIRRTFFFRNEEDAVHFKLRWW